MKKPLVIIFSLVAIVIIIVWVLVIKKDNVWDVEDWWQLVVNENLSDKMNQKVWELDAMDWAWMVNEVSSYSVKVNERWEFPWEDISVYDNNWNLVLSLEDKNQPQYFFALYGNYLVLDSGTSASQREMLVYDIPSGIKIFETDYYPWEDWLVLNDDNITFYKGIDQSLYWEYTLPSCENEYDNGYIESYGYTIWEDQANDLGDIQCAYFE